MRFRFLLFVSIAAFIPLALAFVITGELAPRAEEILEGRATAASSALLAKLEAETSKRRELVLRLVALPEIAAAVRDAAASEDAPPPEAVARVRAAVTELFRDEVPELIAIVNQEGAQVVVTSGEPKSYPVE